MNLTPWKSAGAVRVLSQNITNPPVLGGDLLLRLEIKKDNRANDGCVWDGAISAGLWLQSGECAHG